MKLAVVSLVFLVAACGSPSPNAPAAEAGTDSPPENAAGIELTRRWTVDHAKSSLKFEGAQTGTPFEGRFEKWQAEIVFDPEDLSQSSIDVTVDMSSAKTGDAQRDQALPAGDWFKTKEFPTARYRSADIMETAPGKYVARGELTIRGVTRALDLPFSLDIDGPSGHATAETSLARTDYGVGQGDFADGTWVAIDVKVKVDLWAVR